MMNSFEHLSCGTEVTQYIPGQGDQASQFWQKW